MTKWLRPRLEMDIYFAHQNSSMYIQDFVILRGGTRGEITRLICKSSIFAACYSPIFLPLFTGTCYKNQSKMLPGKTKPNNFVSESTFSCH